MDYIICPNGRGSNVMVVSGTFEDENNPPITKGDFPMEYMLMLYVDEAGWPKLTKEQQEQGMAAYAAYTEALNKAGAFKAGSRLAPTSTATTIRVENGKPKVLDGPYPESKEQLGGY